MFYKGRELKRLFEIQVFELGKDRNDPETEVTTETVIAWNAEDAIRRTGDRAAGYPKSLHYVTWPDEFGKQYPIKSTKLGPLPDEVKPSIILKDPTEEDWGAPIENEDWMSDGE